MLGYCHWGCKWSQANGKQYAGTSDTRTELLYDLATPMLVNIPTIWKTVCRNLRHKTWTSVWSRKPNVSTHSKGMKKTLNSYGRCTFIHKAKKLNQPKYPSAGDQTYTQSVHQQETRHTNKRVPFSIKIMWSCHFVQHRWTSRTLHLKGSKSRIKKKGTIWFH